MIHATKADVDPKPAMTHLCLIDIEDAARKPASTKQQLRAAVIELTAEIRRGWREHIDDGQEPDGGEDADASDPSPAGLVRRAAARLREQAAAMRAELDENDYWGSPARGHDLRYRAAADDGLGGPVGAFAAGFTPGLADLLADAWDAEADDMADYPAVAVQGGIGIAMYADQPNPVWTTAHLAAQAYLANTEPPAAEPAHRDVGGRR